MVLDKLYSENKIELPQSLVANERERLLGELEKNIKQQGADLEKIKSASETLIA